MSLRRYLARRVMVGLLILWVIASLNFVIFEVMMQIEPEDMYRGLTRPKPSEEMIVLMMELWGHAERREALLNVSSLGTKEAGWERIGASSHLQKEGDENYILSDMENEIVDFEFENVTGIVLMWEEVNLTIRARQIGINEKIEILICVPGRVGLTVAGVIVPAQSYTYYTINVCEILDSLDRINLAKFYLKHIHISGETNRVYVDCAYLSFQYGGPRSLYTRYFKYVTNMFTWNFGYSLHTWTPIATEMAWRLSTTVLLLGSALVAMFLIGITLGILAASRRGTKLDVLTIGSGMLTWGIPVFFIQMLFLLVFSYYTYAVFGVKVFPEMGIISPCPPMGPFAFMADLAWHLAMPLITLILAGLGPWAFTTRNLLLDTLTQDYIVTARAKGLSERTVLYRHAFTGTLPPIVTMITMSITGIVTGSLITEYIFSLPGIGYWYYKGLMSADYPVIESVLFIFSVLTVFANLAADILYGVVDPRIRVGEPPHK